MKVKLLHKNVLDNKKSYVKVLFTTKSRTCFCKAARGNTSQVDKRKL